MFRNIKNFEVSETVMTIEANDGRILAMEFDHEEFEDFIKGNMELVTSHFILKRNEYFIEFYRPTSNDCVFSLYFPYGMYKRSVRTDILRNGVFNLNRRKHLRKTYGINVYHLSDVEVSEKQMEEIKSRYANGKIIPEIFFFHTKYGKPKFLVKYAHEIEFIRDVL